jgi:hypothetical protein
MQSANTIILANPNRSPCLTTTANPAASAPSPQYSTSWPCKVSPAHLSDSSTRSTRAWTLATSGWSPLLYFPHESTKLTSIRSLVHARLVAIACAAAREDGRGGSQYFLITPKLLSGLEFHPKMTVHCIASGEYMPEDGHETMDFAALAKTTLQLKRAALAR